MTKKSMLRWVAVYVAWLSFVVVIAFPIYLYGAACEAWYYKLYKDLIPVFVSFPLAWLGFCLQRRMSYLQQLRVLWSKLIDAVQKSIQYTYKKKPTQDEYGAVLTSISSAIEEVRGVFSNINESDKNIGLYPFEPIKRIYDTISDLGYGEDYEFSAARDARKLIMGLWKIARTEILKEFDREVPTWSVDYWHLDKLTPKRR